MTVQNDLQLVTETDARAFFQRSVETAVGNQALRVREETVLYIVNLLVQFIRADHLFLKTTTGETWSQPLALLFGEAMAAATPQDRDNALRRLGDIALFTSGLYAGSLARSLVDVDYYIAMGGSAYGCLADSSRVSRVNSALREVFAELAGRFASLVDILAEVGEQTSLANSTDIMRIYEIWLCSGSRHAARKLLRAGIRPVAIRRLPH